MSFTADLIVTEIPAKDDLAWNAILELREEYYEDEGEKAPQLVELHKVLTERYPCLTSYADDDPMMDDSPWADGPMIGNFASKMGMVAIRFDRADEVFPFVRDKALELGITVADGQSELIYRPGVSVEEVEKSPWWKFW